MEIKDINFNETPYKEFIQILEQIDKENKSENPLFEAQIKQIREALKDKYKLITLYRRYCSLDVEGDVFLAIEKKIEYAEKRGLGINFKKHKSFLIKEFKGLLN